MNVEIDWVKVSTIVFEAFLTAVLSAAVILITFFLGQRQARKQQKQQDRSEINIKRIDTLLEIQENLNLFLSSLELTEDRFWIEPYAIEAGEVVIPLLRDKILLYPLDSEPEIHQLLNSLRKSISDWIPDLENRTRRNIQRKRSTSELDKSAFEDNPIYQEMKKNYEHIEALSWQLQSYTAAKVVEFD